MTEGFSLTDQLRRDRQKLGLTQNELAQKLDITQSQISNLERGAANPRLSTIRDIARILNLELMLIPRELLPLVESLIRRQKAEDEKPIYAIDPEDSDEKVEIG